MNENEVIHSGDSREIESDVILTPTDEKQREKQVGRGALAGVEDAVDGGKQEGIYWSGEGENTAAELKEQRGNAMSKVLEIANEDNGYGAETEAEAFQGVGEESKLEADERLAEDKHDLQVEVGRGWEHNLLTRNQSRLTRDAVKQLDTAIKSANTWPAELEAIRLMAMHDVLGTYGRRLGDRN